MSEHVDASKIKDPTIAAARKEVEFQRAMNPCPIDFHCIFQRIFGTRAEIKRVASSGCDSFLYPVSIYNYFVTTLRSTGILASTASPLITF